MTIRSNNTIEIGIIAAGIDEEYQSSTISGIIRCAKELKANVSCFAAFAGVISSSRYDTGEYNIFSLINYRRLDGIILMAHTISDPVEKDKIIRRVKRSHLPTVIFDCGDYPEFFNITTDNYKAMSEIVSHVIKVHNAKTINYISGPVSNPESEARYEAFINVLAENGIASDSRRTFFGDFRPSDGEKAVREFIKSGLPMPDAIICANDAMALSAMEELQASGLRVPEDVIVTGFDDIYNARHTTPSLTTISRHLDNAGYTACKTLISMIGGETPSPLPPLYAEPVFRGSCGCCSGSDPGDERRSMFSLINSVRRDISLLNRITTELAETETAEENFAAAASCLRELKCERFSICLCENWDSAFSSDDLSDLLVKGYTSRMSAPMILTRNGTESVMSFRSSAMQPVPLRGTGNVSYFLPLHFRERCLGYYVITGSDFPLRSLLCHTLLLNISNSIENIRKLIHLGSMISELDRLYVIDPLCGIYNRNGFIRSAGNIFNHCQQTHASVIISFIDMDGLKIINDNYGHDEGDFALRSLASAINECCKGSGRICARFGGDEFIILGENASQEDVQPLESALKKQIGAMNRIMNKPYDLSASIGTIVAPIDEGDTLFGLITLADSLMYERKKKKKTSRYLRHD